MRLLVDISSIPKTDKWNTGLARYALTVLNGFRDAGYKDISVLATREKLEDLKQWFPGFNVVELKRFRRIPVISKPFPRFFLDAFRRRNIINEMDCEVVFMPFLGKQFDFLKIKKPLVLTVHDLQLYRVTSPLKSFVTKYMMFPKIVRQATGIIAISDFVKKDLVSFFKGVDKDKVTVIHNGVLLPDKEDNPGLGDGERYILTINSLLPYKNALTLVKAFDQIKDTIQHKLVVVGKSTKYWERTVCKYITEKGLEERIVHLDFVSDGSLLWLYRNADLFVTTSLMEGFGFTPVEAAMAGTRVISTKETALPESTMGLVNYYEPATDPSALAEKILEVLDKKDDEEIKNISARFHEEYDPVARARDIYSYLETMV